MHLSPLLLTTLLALPAAALVVGCGWALARVAADLRSFDGFEGLHLEG